MGKLRRMQRIFREDGNAIITALDHGSTSGPVPGVKDIDATVKQVVAAGTDAIICNIGVAKKCETLLRGAGLIIRMDFPCTEYARNSHDSALFQTVEDAVRVGADAVLFTGGPDVEGTDVGMERATMKALTTLERECARYGMPLIAEMYPGGWNPPPDAINIESLKLAARWAAEFGADALKMPYRPGYEEVVEGVWVPVVVLGGAKTNSQEQFFQNIYDAKQAGAHGVAIGRNIWGHEHPDRVVKLLQAIFHEGKDLAAAMSCLN